MLMEINRRCFYSDKLLYMLSYSCNSITIVEKITIFPLVLNQFNSVDATLLELREFLVLLVLSSFIRLSSCHIAYILGNVSNYRLLLVSVHTLKRPSLLWFHRNAMATFHCSFQFNIRANTVNGVH